MLGLGPQAICIIIDFKIALTNCNIVVPRVQELSKYAMAQEVSNTPVLEITGIVSFKG
jgi:hypothetical protein